MTGRKIQSEKRWEAIRLFESGLNYKEIGTVLGVTGSTVHRWVDPDYHVKSLEQKSACDARHRKHPKIRVNRCGVRSKAKISLAKV